MIELAIIIVAIAALPSALIVVLLLLIFPSLFPWLIGGIALVLVVAYLAASNHSS